MGTMKKLFYIDYPQEHFEEQLHRYRCAYCKIETTVINGRLEGHHASCTYRIKLSAAGHSASGQPASVDPVAHDADDFD